MMCSALLAARSPPRLSRCRTVFPDDAGTGLTPHSDAKPASDLNLSGLSPAVRRSCAAPMWPIELRAPCGASLPVGRSVFELGRPETGVYPLTIGFVLVGTNDPNRAICFYNARSAPRSEPSLSVFRAPRRWSLVPRRFLITRFPVVLRGKGLLHNGLFTNCYPFCYLRGILRLNGTNGEMNDARRVQFPLNLASTKPDGFYRLWRQR